MIVVLDSGVVGLVTTPNATGEAAACKAWLRAHGDAGTTVVLPDIIDYETRRALLHRGFASRLRELDALAQTVLTVRVTRAVLLDAAGLWAEARQAGRKTSDDRALDVDVILCAQARSLAGAGVPPAVVATTNVRHLAPSVDARRWVDVPVPGGSRGGGAASLTPGPSLPP